MGSILREYADRIESYAVIYNSSALDQIADDLRRFADSLEEE